jgi:hypothetical protein
VAGTFPLVRRSQYSLAGTFHRRRPRLLRTGFFRQVRELENTKENSRPVLYLHNLKNLFKRGE